jgi:hypothetical protein
MCMNVCSVLRSLLFTLLCPYLATSDDLIDRLGTSAVKVALHKRVRERLENWLGHIFENWSNVVKHTVI